METHYTVRSETDAVTIEVPVQAGGAMGDNRWRLSPETTEATDTYGEWLAAKKLAEITPGSAELGQLAAKFPPPIEWFDEEPEPPPY